MLNFFVGVVALSLLIDANASCPNLDDVANGSFVTDRFVATSVETYADLAVALSCLYDDVANGQDTGAELLYTQDEDFTRFIPNTEWQMLPLYHRGSRCWIPGCASKRDSGGIAAT